MSHQDEEFNDLLQEALLTTRRSNVTLDEALALLAMRGRDRGLLESVRLHIAEQSKKSLRMKEHVLNKDSYPQGSWYAGPMSQGHWHRYMERMQALEAPGLDELMHSATQVTGLLANPRKPGHKRKGLVVGNVQSGKTRNFAGVVAQAADAGYKLIIVLSGIHNNLRRQTQSRLVADVFDPNYWHGLTTPDCDFEYAETTHRGVVVNPNQVILNSPNMPLYAVVKKNTKRLGNLVEWFRSIPDQLLPNVPVLIIDDEADQATPNSAARLEDTTAINKRLKDLWSMVSVGSYVAYTATPFATVLINPDDDTDLFPSDFVTLLEPGKGYFGAEQVFGLSESVNADGETPDHQAADMVRTIPDHELSMLVPRSKASDFQPSIPPSLNTALLWFIVATAARRARGQEGHSSMLVHVTHYKGPHFKIQRALAASLDHLRERVRAGEIGALRKVWQDESTKVDAHGTTIATTWESIEPRLGTVLDEARVIVDNSDSEDRLDYGDEPRTIIAVGGGTLSRGLTLEGLVTSYFTRSSSTYDTLLQMGRWFGYRQGYGDLPRLWVSRGLDEDYKFLATVETELRTEIRRVAGQSESPKQLGLRIKSHPGRLEVTARNKMRHAQQVQVGLGGTVLQSLVLDGSPRALRQSLAAIEGLGIQQCRPWPTDDPHLRFTGVTSGDISNFLGAFPRTDTGVTPGFDRVKLAQQWLDEVARAHPWNVVIVGRGEDSLGRQTVAGHSVPNINRAPLNGSDTERLRFKGIKSLRDLLLDIPAEELPRERPTTETDIRRIRFQWSRENGFPGLLLLYPISKDSAPRTAAREHVTMPVDHDAWAYVVAFPYLPPQVQDTHPSISVRAKWDSDSTADEDDASDIEANEKE